MKAMHQSAVVGVLSLLLTGGHGMPLAGMLQFGFFLAVGVFATVCTFAPRRVLLSPRIAATIGVSNPNAARAVCAVTAVVFWCLSLAPVVLVLQDKDKPAQPPLRAEKVAAAPPPPAKDKPAGNLPSAAEKEATEREAAKIEAAKKATAERVAAEKAAAEKEATAREAAKKAADLEALAKAKMETLQRRLRGEWSVTDVRTGDNVPMRLDSPQPPTCLFRAEEGSSSGTCSVVGVPQTSGGQAYLNLAGLFERCTYKLDANANLVAIDLIPPTGQTVLGILEFKDNGVLRLRFSNVARPHAMELGGEGQGEFRSLIALSRKGQGDGDGNIEMADAPPTARAIPKYPLRESGVKVDDVSCGILGGDASKKVSIATYSGSVAQVMQSNGGPPTGTLWFIAEGGLIWKGKTLAAGTICRADENRQPQPTTAGEYSVWGKFDVQEPACASADDKGEVLYTIPAKQWVQLLLVAKGTHGWHKVRWGTVGDMEGWVNGNVEEVEFRRHLPAAPTGEEDRSENTGSVPAGPPNSQSVADPPPRPAVRKRAPGTLDLRDPFDTPPQGWPEFSGRLAGQMQVRIKNPNDFRVRVGLRCDGKGLDFVVPASGTRSAFVPNGHYDIYFQYSKDSSSVYQGDSFTLNNNGVEIQIVQVVDGNYGIRKVN